MPHKKLTNYNYGVNGQWKYETATQEFNMYVCT